MVLLRSLPRDERFAMNLTTLLAAMPEKKGHRENTSWEAGFDQAITEVEAAITSLFKGEQDG